MTKIPNTSLQPDDTPQEVIAYLERARVSPKDLRIALQPYCQYPIRVTEEPGVHGGLMAISVPPQLATDPEPFRQTLEKLYGKNVTYLGKRDALPPASGGHCSVLETIGSALLGTFLIALFFIAACSDMKTDNGFLLVFVAVLVFLYCLLKLLP